MDADLPATYLSHAVADQSVNESKSFHLDDLLLPKQTAQILRVTTGTLSVWRSTGRYPLKYVKVGRWVLYRYRDILEFIDLRTKTHVA